MSWRGAIGTRLANAAAVFGIRHEKYKENWPLLSKLCLGVAVVLALTVMSIMSSDTEQDS